MKKKLTAMLTCLTVFLTACGGGSIGTVYYNPQSTTSQNPGTPGTTSAASGESTAEHPGGGTIDLGALELQYLEHVSLLAGRFFPRDSEVATPMSYQTQSADLSNVYIGGFYLDDEVKALLGKNGFAMREGYHSEFFQTYESNRYMYCANYVTVDSMMHTYHLYFAYLLKKLEMSRLSDSMLDVSREMQAKAVEHFNALKGTEWESAARLELAYFTVGARLLDPYADIPGEVSAEVVNELSMIEDASGIQRSNVFYIDEDYSQFKPRGYYDSSEALQRYFKAMMWYGRMGFAQEKEMTNRASVLVTMAMEGEALRKWENVYSVTSFFAGASDDISYYETKPLVDAVFGEGATVADLPGKDAQWQQYEALSRELPPPAINSVPVADSLSDEEKEDAQLGFRFMGQRFSIDESCFTQLCYHNVKENAAGEKRSLPDALDFPAALGSDTALSILEESGKTNYPNYYEQLDKVRSVVKDAPVGSWTANLYSAWIYTLLPSIEEKDESYPPFMRTDAWKRKALMSFEGSYTELKHDTILYSKQMMGEMGGGDIPEYDDRGYVEAEPEVFARLEALVDATQEGLSSYGLLDGRDQENLSLLGDLAGKLQVIARKELNGELPTDEEFDLIRCYGGQLEHFWEEVMDGEYPDESYHAPDEHPAPLVADIATDPNGVCLEVATGKPLDIYTIVEVDGVLKVASGSVYSFYQFEQPLSNRLTDSEWRIMIGAEVGPDGSYHRDSSVQMPGWYSDLVYAWSTYY